MSNKQFYVIDKVKKSSAWYGNETLKEIKVSTWMGEWDGPWYEGRLEVKEDPQDLMPLKSFHVIGVTLKKVNS